MKKQDTHILNNFSIQLWSVKAKLQYFFMHYFRGLRTGSKLNCGLIPSKKTKNFKVIRMLFF